MAPCPRGLSESRWSPHCSKGSLPHPELHMMGILGAQDVVSMGNPLALSLPTRWFRLILRYPRDGASP